MAHRTMPDQTFLRECFDYDPLTGDVTWRKRPRHHFVSAGAWKRWNTCCAGKPASATAHRFGHRQIALLAQNWLAHRLIWKWVTGEDPIEVDHEDRNPANNQWQNLRLGGYGGNARNRSLIAGTKTGLKGVEPIHRSRRFYARIRINGKPTRFGPFDTAEDAHAAYCEAARKHFGEFWCAG